MDGIITIVIIVAAVIFKLVGKKLGSAAGDEVFPTISVDPDPMTDCEIVEEPAERPYSQPEPVVADELVVEEASRVLPTEPVKADPCVKKDAAPVLVEEASQQKEKIDPKKLIVYSEIMKPKYME